MRLFFLLIAGILAILPLYSNTSDDSNDADVSDENNLIEQPESDVKIKNNQESIWNTIFLGKLGYSDKISNFIIGLDLTMMREGEFEYATISHTFSLEYQYQLTNNNPQSIIRIDYVYASYILFWGGGIGISSFYNINNNDIGIAPKIGISVVVPLYIFSIELNYIFNCYYRYNFVLNNVNNSYGDFVLSISLVIPIKDRI
jgi:hypothetical protein